ncbi:MAG: hypothetical protein WA971_13705 [Microbacterium sp.]
MTEPAPTRRDILRPLHLVGLAAVAGVFAAIVTMVSTGAFTDRVNDALAKGTYQGMPPIILGLVVGGGAFIVTLLGLAMLMLAVDPADVVRRHDTPVLYDADQDAAGGPDAAGSGGPDAGPSGSTGPEAPRA